MRTTHPDEVPTDATLARRLVAAQFPEWAHLPIGAAPSQGTDNAMYRLGDELAVRLPRMPWAAAPLEREYRWLPLIAPQLPVAAPLPLALGRPADGYPWHWTVCRWLVGEHPPVDDEADASSSALAGQHDLARDLAAFARAMRDLDPDGAPTTAWPLPLAGEDDFVSGQLAAIGATELDAIWSAARSARPPATRTWIHGDLSPGNLLVADGRLTGVLDFGTMGLGDPASEHRVAWNLLGRTTRETYRAAVDADDDEWARARGWALLQALAQLAHVAERHPPIAAGARRVLAELLSEHAD
ncbi:hypothetical protein ARHIZOSPH14_09890 [Agromyces rhizosphaerae]|uniref:Aminoglycoside phosphotransferase domain-containing protein n=1 Tax=Agromyces rhizosphaerae TaxID=88374 RepID=A0A9W6FQL4_9MICO|nr:aminoglycoside phosphotransferase family protein [Agromyces rhizosphaerae]GLI26747.1 hypothetical protein ARHIZOSPH14_09890 [Agromyces rhizosphaerae]